MATEVIMPALGVAQETGRILRWMKAEGDAVSEGEPLLEIETDKVTVSIDAPASGVLAAVRAGEGEEVPVGQVIAAILAPGEVAPGADRAETVPTDTGGAAGVSPPVGGRLDDGGVASASDPSGPSPTDVRKPASPLARRRARQAGLDLGKIRGSGPDGAVTAADLDAAGAAGGEAPRSSGDGGSGADEPVSVGPVWLRMAERTAAAWTSVPHFYLFRDVDAGRLMGWRAALGDEVTLTDLLVWLVARALERHPEVNARWDGDRVRRFRDVNVGIAVAVEDGLVVPVVHGANRLVVREIAERRSDLVRRARSRSLQPEDMRDGTFTVSNLGMFGVDAFAAVINAPQAAILAVGRIADRVVAVKGRPDVRPRMSLALSCDHRTLDGARAARFLDTLAGYVEEPLGLVT